MSSPLDRLDREIIATMEQNRPRPVVSELARSLAIARGTAQARLERLEATGVIRGYGPEVDAAAAGLGVKAFTTLSIAQGMHDSTVDRLVEIPEVVEVNTVTGGGDLLLTIVAMSNDHLHRVIQRIAALPEVTHTKTQLALATPLRRSVASLIGAMDDEAWDA